MGCRSSPSERSQRRKHTPGQAQVIVSRSRTQVVKRCAFRTHSCAVEGMDIDLDAAHSLVIRKQTLLDDQLSVTRSDVPSDYTHTDVRYEAKVASVLRVLRLERGRSQARPAGPAPRA